MTPARTALVTAITGLALLPAAADARKNPYTAAGICGPGYEVVHKKRLHVTNGVTGKRVHLATVVLTYNRGAKRACAVTMKRHRVGLKGRDHLYVSLAARPVGPTTAAGDSGNFAYYAGPARVPVPRGCVQWHGGAQIMVPANWEPRGMWNSAWKSRWVRAADPSKRC